VAAAANKGPLLIDEVEGTSSNLREPGQEG